MKRIGHPGRIAGFSAVASALVIASLALAQSTKPVAPGKTPSPAGVASPPFTAKVLIPKPGGAAPAAGPRQPAPPPPVAMAAPTVDAIVAKIQSSKAGAVGATSPSAPPPPRYAFEIKPSALAGSGPQGAVHFASTVSMSFAEFLAPFSPPYTYSYVEIWGIPDGSWFVDCAVDTRAGAGPYELLSQIWANNALANSTDTIASVPAQGQGHVALGIIYAPQSGNHLNTLFLKQTGPWAWFGCSFKPV
jgi:hypothetical protein